MTIKGELENMSDPCKKVSFVFFDILNLVYLIFAYLLQTTIIYEHGLCVDLQEIFLGGASNKIYCTNIIIYFIKFYLFILHKFNKS